MHDGQKFALQFNVQVRGSKKTVIMNEFTLIYINIHQANNLTWMESIFKCQIMHTKDAAGQSSGVSFALQVFLTPALSISFICPCLADCFGNGVIITC